MPTDTPVIWAAHYFDVENFHNKIYKDQDNLITCSLRKKPEKTTGMFLWA